MLAKRQNEKVEEAPVGTSSVGPYIYNLSTGEIIMYNPGDLIVLSDRDLLDRELLDKDFSCHFGRNFESHQ